MSNSSEKIAVSKIVLRRLEGRSSQCDIDHEVTSYSEAAKVLMGWADTIKASYDKCKFTVTFADGYEYSGNYDLYNLSDEVQRYNFSIKASMNSFLTYFAKEGDIECQELLNKYDI